MSAQEQIDQLNACAQWIETRRSRDIDWDFAEVMRNSAETLEELNAVAEAARHIKRSCVVEGDVFVCTRSAGAKLEKALADLDLVLTKQNETS